MAEGARGESALEDREEAYPPWELDMDMDEDEEAPGRDWWGIGGVEAVDVTGDISSMLSSRKLATDSCGRLSNPWEGALARKEGCLELV